METVTIAGGSGMIGSALSSLLQQRGYRVILLSRSGNPAAPLTDAQVQTAFWDPAKEEIQEEAIARTDYLINLSGAGVAERRWSASRKREITESRTQSGRLLVRALRSVPNPVKLVINASAIGWYGPDPEIPNPAAFMEDDPPAADFLGTTCVQWEDSIRQVEQLGKRLVILRIGIVLSANGGAWAAFKKPLGFGVATVLGTGRQVVSWIHWMDLCRIFLYAIENESVRGIYNAVAPVPVSNAELIRALAVSLGRGWALRIRVPAFVLKCALGEMSIEVLKSTTVSSNRISALGFKFQFPHIQPALQDLARRPG